MKVLVINCSPVRDGATAEIVNIVSGCLKERYDVRSTCIDDFEISFCKGCRTCHNTAKCIQHDDVEKVIEQYGRWSITFFSFSIYQQLIILIFFLFRFVNINIKYQGYIERQLRQVDQFKKLENKIIPDDINYNQIKSLRTEARLKLLNLRPASVGQASRISGVSPADISVLLVYLEQLRRNEKNH